ncbi:MAG: RDD family protein, partial [Terracidiphilus sp.]|nr:RDD family protein [Terracidiphilus sp.]
AMSFAAQLPALDLEAQPREQFVDELLEEPEPRPAPGIEPAPMSRRLLATFVDCTLIAGALVAAATLAAYNTSELPGLRALEFPAAVALLAIGVAYYTCFTTLARATPGMRYAGIALSSFSGYTTSRSQRCGRLLALLLSVLPLGLGMVWSLFDDAGLTWHDRLSKTYLRKR